MSAAEKEIYMQDANDKIRLAVLETTTENVGSTLLRIEKRFDAIDERLKFIEIKFDKKFEQIDKRFDETQKEVLFLHKENQNNFRWIMGVILGIYGIIFTFMGKGLIGH